MMLRAICKDMDWVVRPELKYGPKRICKDVDWIVRPELKYGPKRMTLNIVIFVIRNILLSKS